MLANHPGGFLSLSFFLSLHPSPPRPPPLSVFFPAVYECYPSVSCQCQWEIYRAVTSRQPGLGGPSFAAATAHVLSLWQHRSADIKARTHTYTHTHTHNTEVRAIYWFTDDSQFKIWHRAASVILAAEMMMTKNTNLNVCWSWYCFCNLYILKSIK